MSTGYTWKSLTSALLTGIAVLCMAGSSFAVAQHAQKKPTAAKKAPPKVPPAPLPSGPTGPMQPMPLDSIAAVPPQVTYQNNQLTIVAPNSTLADILRAVRKQTGAEIDVPQAPERVVTRLGPGPARDVIAELLNGSRFNYVLLGSPENDALLTRVVLVAKSGIQDIAPNPGTPEANRGIVQANAAAPPPEPPDVNDQEPPPAEDNVSNVPEEPAPEPPAAEADQQPGDPNGIKTPQQMLQEMQQRQMQLQQQQQQGNQSVGPSGMPPHPPREQ